MYMYIVYAHVYVYIFIVVVVLFLYFGAHRLQYEKKKQNYATGIISINMRKKLAARVCL